MEIEKCDRIAAGVVLFNPDERTEECLIRLREQGYCLCTELHHGKSWADGYEWVLTMDQDSILPDGMVADFSKYLDEPEIGIVCPKVVDKRRAYMEVQLDDSIEYIDMCITSASCTSIKAWEQIGKFDEWLFIDLVDNEFCKRLVESGYKILRLNKWVLDQEFGKIEPKSEKVQRYWIRVSKLLHNQNFAKFGYRKHVSLLRVYCTCRNIIM